MAVKMLVSPSRMAEDGRLTHTVQHWGDDGLIANCALGCWGDTSEGLHFPQIPSCISVPPQTWPLCIWKTTCTRPWGCCLARHAHHIHWTVLQPTPAVGTVCSRPMGRPLLSHLSIGTHVSGYQELFCTSHRELFKRSQRKRFRMSRTYSTPVFFFVRLVEMNHRADPSDVSYEPPSPSSSGW